MNGLGKSISKIVNTVAGSKTIFLLRIIGSLSGLAAGFVKLLFPGNPVAESVVQWTVVVAVALVLLSIVIQVVEKLMYHFSDQIAYAIVSEKYGYGYESLHILAYLDPSSGAMRIHRRVCLRATATQRCVRHYLHGLGESEGSIEIGGLHTAKPSVTEMTIEKVPELSYKDRMVMEVTFEPPLDAKKVAQYEIKEEFAPGTFATTAKEMEEVNRPVEYLSWHIGKPTKNLRLEMYIPASLNPKDIGYDAWYGGYSQQRHGNEWNRLTSCFAKQEDPVHVCIQLDIPFPVLGLLYVIRWKY